MNIWTLTLPSALIVVAVPTAIGLPLIWLGDKAIGKLWPEEEAAPYVPPGPGLDMDAIYSNPNLRFADPAPKANKPPRTEDCAGGNNVNAGL